MLRSNLPSSKPSTDQLARSVRLLMRLFVGRTDAWAEQQRDGRYLRRSTPLTEQILRAHVRGERTAGAYQLDAETSVRYLAFSLDATDGVAFEKYRKALNQQVQMLVAVGRAAGLKPLIEFSGRRGFHLLIPIDAPVPSAVARPAGEWLLREAGRVSRSLTIEIFPKQARLSGKGLGNLIKLPWGRHRLGGRSVFVDEDLEPIGPGFTAQLEHLERAPLSPAAAIRQLGEEPQDHGAETNTAAHADGGKASPAPAGCDEGLRRLLTLLQTDTETRDLFRGEAFTLRHYNTCSDAEFALALRLLRRGVTPERVNAVLHAAGIGKWTEADEQYRRFTLHKAMERVQHSRCQPRRNGKGRSQQPSGQQPSAQTRPGAES